MVEKGGHVIRKVGLAVLSEKATPLVCSSDAIHEQ
jgi:hypothetical protein